MRWGGTIQPTTLKMHSVILCWYKDMVLDVQQVLVDRQVILRTSDQGWTGFSAGRLEVTVNLPNSGTLGTEEVMFFTGQRL